MANGATWSQAQIDALAGDMDTFIAAYVAGCPRRRSDPLRLPSLVQAQLGAIEQQISDVTDDRDAQQGVADVANGAVASKQAEIAAKQDEIDSASVALDGLLENDLGVVATHVSGNTWEADVSGLDDGLLAVSATVTDDAGNDASVVGSFRLDTSADVDTNFAVSVAADDLVTNLAESTDVSLSLSGIDSDAASVSVEISDAGDNSVSADATYDESGWTVADLDLTGLADGTLTVSAAVTDAAGNAADALTASLELDTVADIGNDLSRFVRGR